MTEHEPNPYEAPSDAAAKPIAARGRLGIFLIAFLGLQVAGNLFFIGMLLFAPDMAHASDPRGPPWSFPARIVFAALVVAACIGILAKRRAALYAYFAISMASLPLNVARGVTSIPALIGGAIAAPTIVWLLIRKDIPVLR